MIIYRVFDEEYEKICGEQQLAEFTLNQMANSPDDFIEENIREYFEEADKILELIDKVLSDETYLPTVEECKTLLHIRAFEVEDMEVY